MISDQTTFAVATAPRRNSRHWSAGVVSWGELRGWAENFADRKDSGNYLLGTLRPRTTVQHTKNGQPCTDTHRRKEFVVSRSAVTLDVDSPAPGFADKVELVLPYASLLHTTFNSTPDDLRYRLIVPTDREMAPDEYITVARHVMAQLGPDQFDPGTTQPERYMFRPAAKRGDWFEYRVAAGPALEVDAALDDFVDDLSTVPMPNPGRNKRDPYSLDGVIGAFNTAYRDDWDLLIKTYELPYEKTDEDRYQLAGARAQAGMGPINGAEGLVYSHHANDPAYGHACSAFDLVRMHRFHELDEGASSQTPVNRLPSHLAMVDLASTDHRVTAQLVGADFGAELEETADDGDWRLRLRLARGTGKVMDVIQNWDLIRANDPAFNQLQFNELSLSVEAAGDLPWRSVTPATAVVGNVDRWEFCYYLERVYGFRPTRTFTDSLIDTRAQQNVVNPVRDYLSGLVWDGKKRVHKCLPGVTPTPYTKLVARKVLVAAVARMFEPGCKWDHTLVLYGPEGMGKTWWVHKLAKGYSAALGRLDNKDTLLAMQRSWIMLSDEGYSLRKNDAEAQKEFLTRTEDVFRMPYDRETLVHPRHSVIWSTTDNPTFLRRQEGNRRFLTVHCERKVNFDKITDDYVDQLWAEAVHLYRAGELLFLETSESQAAAAEREQFVEEDALTGVLEEFLNTLVPEDWYERSPDARRQWMLDRNDGFVEEGTMPQLKTCSTQLWVEALGRRLGDHRRMDLLDIADSVKKLSGWKALPGRHRVPGYGPQLMFVREGVAHSPERE